jgi:MFS transporter, AAHS family, 4-hydroxybenzoate transporter
MSGIEETSADQERQMLQGPPIEVTQWIDERAFGVRQGAIVLLCALVALLDGMDLQSIGLAAPLMTKDLEIAPPAFGAVFSAALAGLALGAFALGPLADRFGRKRVLIGATLAFGLFTLLTAAASNLGELLAYRFLTGVGLGGAMPSFISLASDYVPRRMRASVTSLLWAGFPLGGVVGGLLGSRIIPAFGWRSVFVAGGAPALILAGVLALALPESLGYLIRSGAPPARVAAAFKRAFGRASLPDDARLTVAQTEHADVRPAQLFAAGQVETTLLLWVAFFFTFMILVVNSAWSPTLLSAQGVPVAQSALALALFNFGSLFGSGAAGLMLHRFGTVAILPAAYVGGALAYASIGAAAPSFAAIAILQGLFGLFEGSASSGVIALAALIYPAPIRASGLGFAMAAGRLGSFAGPLVVGALVGARWPTEAVYFAIGSSTLIGALACLWLGLRRPLIDEAVAT